MSKLPWFRLYSEMINDRKIDRVSRTLQLPKSAIVGAWVTILCLANESPVRGSLMLSDDIPMSDDEIAYEFDLGIEETRRILDAFIGLKMLVEADGYTVSNWDSRQFKSDNSTARVKKYREKKRRQKRETLPPSGGETLLKRFSNVIETDTEKDTETETEKDGGFRRVVKAYQDNIGAITAMVSEQLQVDIEEYSAEWVYDAIREAVNSEKRSLRYVQGILRNWKREGRGAKKNGSSKPDKHEVLEHLMTLVSKYGRRRANAAFSEMTPELQQTVKQMGGWTHVCGMSQDNIRIKYFQALNGSVSYV